MKKLIGLVVSFLLFALVLASCLRCGERCEPVVLRVGDRYDERIEMIKENFVFMFRLEVDGKIFDGFAHRDTSDFLVFQDGLLVCIGNDDHRVTVCDVFKELESGKEYRICHALYSDPLAKARSLISQIDNSRSEIWLGGTGCESQGLTYDWGLTVAAVGARVLSCLMPVSGDERRSLVDELGFGYDRISIGSDETGVQSILGPPVYTDNKYGVRYFGKYETVKGEDQLLGLVCSNGTIRAVFSDKLLDSRVTYKCSRLEYQGDK